MADIVIDENGKQIDGEGKSKETAYAANSIPKGTVDEILSEFSILMNYFTKNISKATDGVDLNAGTTSLDDAMTVLYGGDFVDFHRKNKQLADAAERSKYLKTPAGPESEAPDLVVAFWDALAQTLDLRLDICKFLKDLDADGLWRIYHAVHFDSNMKKQATPEFMNWIDWVFKEFDELYTTCKSDNIFKAIGEDVSKKTFSDYELTVCVQIYMDEKIAALSDLKTALTNSKSVNPSGDNTLYTLSRNTREFWGFASRPDSIDGLYTRCCELRARVNKEYASMDSRVHGVLDGMHDMLYILEQALDDTRNILSNFRNKANDYPYCVLHVSSAVESVVSKYSLGEIKDPVVYGTDYHKFIRQMPIKLQSLVKEIVNKAPLE